MPFGDWEPSLRDKLIDRVRRGQMTPEEAEAEAARQEFGPIATKPNPIDFDPDKMSWWSLPMSLAWIAWRTAASVKENCAEFREDWLEWFPGSWNVPIEGGQRFERIDGYELRSLRGSNLFRLTMSEVYMREEDELPSTAQLTTAEAEKELLNALAAGALVAIAKDRNGNVVDIPQREWPYLELFIENDQDVLKHDALREAVFTEIKLKRADIQRLWAEFLIEAQMIEPMTRAGTAGYVPLCATIHWIMTDGGSLVKQLKDEKAWSVSIGRLLPLISTGEVEMIGRHRNGGPADVIKGHVFAGVLVPAPLSLPFSVLSGDDPWINCTPYSDDPHWKADFNDQLFLGRPGGAEWTHLSVRKADVLRQIHFEQNRTIGKAVYETGAPGRPTSMQFIRAEFETRSLAGLLAPTITQEAAALSTWLSQAHPDAPRVKPKTIKNQLGDAYRNARAQK
jgi:hypothetical protein